jgi:short-subunit dehydrogenase
MPDHTSRFNLEDKRALVTGASRGIGAEITTLFADAGTDVGIVDRDAQDLEATRQAIAVKGRRSHAGRLADVLR